MITFNENQRVHFGSDLLDLKMTYEKPLFVTHKPRGLWYGFGDSWISWCFREGCNSFVNKRNSIHELNIDLEQILVIDSKEKLIEFSNKYGTSILGRKSFKGFKESVDWAEVMSQYKGIEISPYYPSFDLGNDFFWYFGWDCASGCLWDLSCLKEEPKLLYSKADQTGWDYNEVEKE